MHELSIALELIDAATELARKHQLAPVNIRLRLGAMSGVIKEALVGAYEMAREGTELAGCGLIVEELPLFVFCEKCGGERLADSIQRVCCSVCGSPGRLCGGREIEIVGLEVNDDSANTTG